MSNDEDTPRQGWNRNSGPPLTRSQRNSSLPVWNGTAKGVVVGLVVALVGGLVFSGIPALFETQRDGDVRDAVQDEQIRRMRKDIREVKAEVREVKGIVVRIERRVSE